MTVSPCWYVIYELYVKFEFHYFKNRGGGAGLKAKRQMAKGSSRRAQAEFAP